jgi:hypothetical protein
MALGESHIIDIIDNNIYNYNYLYKWYHIRSLLRSIWDLHVWSLVRYLLYYHSS